jgi:hypothetical protein
VILQHVKGIAHRDAVVKSHAARKSARLQEALDEVCRAAVVPVKFFAPMASFFEQQRLDLADSRLAQVNDVHG